MEDISLQVALFLIVFGFLAAFIDSVVGGGGLISIPALLFVGLSPSIAIGTNKLAATMGSFTSTLYFIRSKKVELPLIGKLIPLTVIGAVLGAFTVKFVSPAVLKPLILVMLVLVAVYIMVKKDWGSHSTYKGMGKGRLLFFIIIIFTLGFYDGFFGPGTGSFLIFAFLTVGFDFVRAAASGRVLNFASNIASLCTFFFLDAIKFEYGIIMGIAMIAGAYTGANFAVKKGVSYIRILFLIVTLMLISKSILEYIHII
ncbi:TSUP family transporter [Bacillus sp. 165]|uniref:TSUP family transporter n=1 Tax=Bacillus sp. 165 TaxID=1529117 RepID=UPI001ADA424C|nr:TSUP family transporter [Bacillus sp. 165]MBO9131260.1 TSUP family transporter [Bacillus sp. 165]